MSSDLAARPDGDEPCRPPRIFYGWWIVLGGFIAAALSSSSGFFGPGIFMPALITEFGWPRSAIAGAVSMYFLVSGLIGPLIGRYIDRHGPRGVLAGGAVLMSAGLLALTQVTSLWQVYAVWFLLALGWGAFGAVTISATAAPWFVRRRSLAMSLTVTGFSFGGIVVVPWVAWLTTNLGWRVALVVLAMVLTITVVPLARFVIVRRPSDLGLLPDGDTVDAAAGPPKVDPDWTVREAARTVTFWAIVVAFSVSMIVVVGYTTNQIAYLVEAGVSAQEAAIAVSVMAGATLVGRLALGFLSGWLPLRMVAMLFFLIQSGGVALLLSAESTRGFYLSAGVFGLTTGVTATIQPVIIANCFGIRSFGAIMGWVTLMTQVGMALGPSVPAVIFDLLGSYRPAFMALASFGVLSAVAIAFASAPQRALELRAGVPEVSRAP